MNNKGFALIYVMMTMIIVFSICALSITLALSQSAIATEYVAEAEKELFSYQIGEIFYESSDTIDLKNELDKLGFVESNNIWTLSSGKNEYTLEILQNGDIKTAYVKVNDKLYLIVAVSYDGTKELISWSKFSNE